MAHTIASGKRVVRRPDGVLALNLSLDKDAVVLMRQYASSSKGYGRFLSRLIFEFHARRQVVQQVTGAIRAVDSSKEVGG